MSRHNVKINLDEETMLGYKVSSERELEVYFGNIELYVHYVNDGNIPEDIVLYEVHFHLQQALEV